MAQFRVLGPADVTQILGLFGLPPDVYLGHRPIAAGTINTNLQVETRDGRRFLRINEGKSSDDVAHEAAIVTHLAQGGVATPVPYRSTAGEPYAQWNNLLVSLFPWLPGRTLARVEVTARHAAQAGQALARLHLAGLDFSDRRAGRYEPPAIDSRIGAIALAAASEPQLGEAVAVLRPELAALAQQRAPALPTGVIHGDLFIDNVLFDGDALVAVLDFEQASWGRLAYDLAVTTLAFGFGRDDFRPEIVRALLDGYGQQRPLTDPERIGFGAELRFAACRFAVTRITDVHLKRGAGAAPGKDFRRYLARLDRVHQHLEARDGLLDP